MLMDNYMFIHHSTTLLFLWLIVKVRLFLGLLPEKWDLEVLRRILRMQRKWLLRIVLKSHMTLA